MSYLKINNVRIAGVAAAVPTRIKDIVSQPCFANIQEAEKVISVTHVKQSRMVKEGQCCSDLCYEAANKIIESLSWNRREIDALVYVSLSRDFITPSTAGILQHRLGLSTECYAIDVPLACSGYVYGLSVISSLVSGGGIKKALLLVGETTSCLQSPLDKSLWPLHGDAGTATAIEFTKDTHPIYFHLATDGSRADSIINRDGGVRHPFSIESLDMHQIEPGIIRNNLQSHMDGMNVFGFSIKEPPSSILNLCTHFNLDLKKISYLYLHQANKYMDEKIAKKLHIEADKVPYSMMFYGNTSSASIPMTMVVSTGEQLSNETVDVILCGFGSGLSWGSAYLTLSNVICPSLIEVD